MNNYPAVRGQACRATMACSTSYLPVLPCGCQDATKKALTTRYSGVNSFEKCVIRIPPTAKRMRSNLFRRLRPRILMRPDLVPVMRYIKNARAVHMPGNFSQCRTSAGKNLTVPKPVLLHFKIPQCRNQCRQKSHSAETSAGFAFQNPTVPNRKPVLDLGM